LAILNELRGHPTTESLSAEHGRGRWSPPDKIGDVIEFMLYYGFLGVKMDAESVRYSFDVGYDMKLLKVLVAKAKHNLTYVLNPAFYPGLNL
jgi:hypothetical protein